MSAPRPSGESTGINVAITAAEVLLQNLQIRGIKAGAKLLLVFSGAVLGGVGTTSVTIRPHDGATIGGALSVSADQQDEVVETVTGAETRLIFGMFSVTAFTDDPTYTIGGLSAGANSTLRQSAMALVRL